MRIYRWVNSYTKSKNSFFFPKGIAKIASINYAWPHEAATPFNVIHAQILHGWYLVLKLPHKRILGLIDVHHQILSCQTCRFTALVFSLSFFAWKCIFIACHPPLTCSDPGTAWMHSKKCLHYKCAKSKTDISALVMSFFTVPLQWLTQNVTVPKLEGKNGK